MTQGRVNFNDVDSIVAWIKVHPRHLPMLRGLWKILPAFRGQIRAAVDQVKEKA